MAKNDNATEGTYSTKPFISHDGKDDNGIRAQVKVVMGYGDVLSITDSKGGKSKKVEFAVSNTEYFPSGWTRDAKLQAMLEQAQDTKEPIHFRIETRRKDDVDREKPFDQLDTNRGAEIVKSLAALRFEGDDNWTISQDAVTRMDEDPKTAGGLIKASEQSLDELRPANRTENSGNSRNGNFEPAPYVAIWRDDINPGTIAVGIPINFLANLLEFERETGISIDQDKRKEIAKSLMRVANQLQKDIYTKFLKVDYPGIDLTAGSHTRARALIFETLRSYAPLTEDILEDDEAMKQWLKKVYSISYAMWGWAIEVVDEFIN